MLQPAPYARAQNTVCLLTDIGGCSYEYTISMRTVRVDA